MSSHAERLRAPLQVFEYTDLQTMRFSISRYFFPILLCCCFVLSGCYQASMTTGKQPGDTVVEKKWASSFIYGIVPAKVDVSDECPNGIASAKRKMSFVNGLVGTLTLNIYLPQNVKVTCAAGGSMSSAVPETESDFTLSEEASTQEVNQTLSAASAEAAMADKPVTVQVAAE